MLLTLSCSHREVLQLQKWLGWNAELGGCADHDALIVSGFLNSPETNATLLELAKTQFRSVELISMWYEPTEPWPVPCNAMFQRAARHISETRKCPWFWCESDCIPLKPGWLDAWEKEYIRSAMPFMGCIVQAPFEHMTGNGIYPGSLEEFSAPMLLAHDIAWDVIDSKKIVPLVHHTDLYFHWWSHQRGEATKYSPQGTEFDSLEKLAMIPHRANILHRDKTGSVIDRIRERRNRIFNWPPPGKNAFPTPRKRIAIRRGFKKKEPVTTP